jgi:hypothetical protein
MPSALYRQHIFNERDEMPITVLIVDEEIVRKLIRVAPTWDLETWFSRSERRLRR